MGGDVVARSEAGRGSTFELVLPVRFGQSMRASAPSGGARLLVVDDEEAFRYIVRHIAEDLGLEVDEAPDGDTGLRLVKQRAPDVIVLDLIMPGLDGFGFLVRLGEGGLERLPVIVCTSQVLSMDQKRSLAGAYAILPKHEVSREALGALVKAALASDQEMPA